MSVSGILILGKPGTGKSTSLMNLDPATTIIFTPNIKALPWRGSAKQYKVGENRFVTSNLATLKLLLEKLKEKKPTTKTIVLEDMSHMLTAVQLEDSFVLSKDWGKWNILAKKLFDIIQLATEKLDSLDAVIMVQHTDTDESGVEGFASSGKLIANLIKPASYFTYIYHSLVKEGENEERNYLFLTNFDSVHLAKTPLGLHKELYVSNNVVEIIKTIKNYENYEEPTKESTN